MRALKFLFLLFIVSSCSNDAPTYSKEAPKNNPEEPEPLGTKIVSIEFPSNFVGTNIKFHVILSDSIGNIMEAKTYSNSKETMSFYTKKEFNSDTPFSLMFISNYGDVIYDINYYSNLSNSALEGNILFKPNGFSIVTPIVDIDANELKDNILNAQGYGYSMIRINNQLHGHYTSNFNENLGSKNIFIKYYDPYNIDKGGYQWDLIGDISSIATLSLNDFKTDQVEHRHLTTNVPSELPLLLMYGYENKALFDQINGHQIYDTYIPAFGYGGNHYYSFPTIFEKTSFSISFSNYSLFGLGYPPEVISVPNESVSASFLNNKLTFSGNENFEVGRIRLDNHDLNLNMELIFNGQSTDVTLPKIPDGLIPDQVKNTINGGNLRLVQAVAENYETFESYNDYINKVLKTSTPFYINSPKRERIYTSYITTQLLPIFEFPYLERFR